jgi:NAD-specific glutamate dehydrogenase
MKKQFALKQTGVALVAAVSLASVLALPASALSQAANSSSASSNQAKLATLIQRGDSEINRRLASLTTESGKISGATKLTASDKTALSSEVSVEVSGLTSVKTTLDSAPDLASAKADAQRIFNDYRVYALLVPKIALVKTADDQQVAESRLSALASKIQSRLTAAQQAKKDITALQTQLNDMTTKLQTAHTISSTMETTVLAFQPSDYNANHSVLSGDRDQLKTAQADNQAALTDAKALVTALKSL